MNRIEMNLVQKTGVSEKLNPPG